MNTRNVFWLLIVLTASFFIMQVTAQLLPLSLTRTATNNKSFENGVVTCGSTFCDPSRCSKKLVVGKLVYKCLDG
ncbi:hypothetical protein V3C99_001666 [Haemonchus contortus]